MLLLRCCAVPDCGLVNARGSVTWLRGNAECCCGAVAGCISEPHALCRKPMRVALCLLLLWLCCLLGWGVYVALCHSLLLLRCLVWGLGCHWQSAGLV
jgi:hypothetical protein